MDGVAKVAAVFGDALAVVVAAAAAVSPQRGAGVAPHGAARQALARPVAAVRLELLVPEGVQTVDEGHPEAAVAKPPPVEIVMIVQEVLAPRRVGAQTERGPGPLECRRLVGEARAAPLVAPRLAEAGTAIAANPRARPRVPLAAVGAAARARAVQVRVARQAPPRAP